MSTLETLQTSFLQDLQELRQLQKRGWRVLPMTRLVKEEHLGRCCFIAEEFLTSTELKTLKNRVGLDEKQWRAYKTKISGS